MVPQPAEESLLEGLKGLPGLKVKLNEPLAPYTSIKIGGPVDYFLEVADRVSLSRTLELLHRHAVPFCLLGKGSNVLVSDRGVRGAVLRLGREFNQAIWTEKNGAVVALVGAAYSVSRLVREAARRGYSGLEFAEGIPGSVGGALVMNAGAHGSEIERIVDRVEGVTARGETVGLRRGQMLFTYRSSNLPPGTIVTRVHLRLAKDQAEAVSSRVRELVARRKKSQPSGYPNSGSMFRNPPGDFAGRLIEAAGLKGKRIGRAEISERHGNFILNLGGAKAEEVRGLMEMARAEVRARFGVELEPEVRLLGEWPEENKSEA
ncbi:MAG: UDP-N-acetylmuramate dehydrogenase [Deltaproteobacteria bacterium]|nr:UDP-N-acetylmuramate dehydrogenase [Deltaproteobacteria bacterium]